MHKVIILLIAILFVLPAQAVATENAGFVDGIWFSKQSTTEGETISIFVAVQNQTNTVANGTVTFYDASELIGQVVFAIAPNNIEPVALEYTLGAGEHPISAHITPSTNSKLTYTTLPVRTIFTKAAPTPAPTPIQESATELLSTLENVASSSAIQTVAEVASNVASTSGMLADNIFSQIDPKAKEIAKALRSKSAELQNEQKVTNSNIDMATSSAAGTSTVLSQSTGKLGQLAAVGLTALAFVFQHWLWHLIVAGSLIILRTIYRSRVI